MNELNELGKIIFLDRYARKDLVTTAKEGDTLVFKQGYQKQAGIVKQILGDSAIVVSNDQEVEIKLREADKAVETVPDEMFKRVAKEMATVEKDSEFWQQQFYSLLQDFKFVPGGRILSGAGVNGLSFFNCFVIKSPEDSRQGIMKSLGEMIEIMSHGGGVGVNLSTLRPKNAYVAGVSGRSSGSVSWGGIYSYATGLIEQGGSRRGALMLMLADWHPDVEEFIDSKREAGKITNANISVTISDRFMQAVKEDKDWVLAFPDTSHPAYNTEWDGNLDRWLEKGYTTNLYKMVKARDLYNKIIASAWASAEPGVWFNERSNKMSNSWYFNDLVSTNPCGR